jgi:hypothetical protein
VAGIEAEHLSRVLTAGIYRQQDRGILSSCTVMGESVLFKKRAGNRKALAIFESNLQWLQNCS